MPHLCSYLCAEPYSEEAFQICAASAASQKAAGNTMGIMKVAVSDRGTQTLYFTNGWHSSKPTKTQFTCPCYG